MTLPTLTLTADFAGGAADLAPYIRNSGFTLTRGSTSPSFTGLIADQGSLRLTLDNESRIFDPSNASGPYFGDLLPGVTVTLIATWNSVAYTLFTGKVSGWPQTYPAVGGRDQTVELQVADRVRQLSRGGLTGTFAKAFTGTRIFDVLTAVGVDVGDMLLNPGTTRVPSTIPGETKSSAWSLIADAASAEWGSVWIHTDNKIHFLDRNGIATNAGSLTSQATFSGPMGSDLPFRDVVVAYDDTRIINDASLSWNQDGNTVTASDATSQNAYGVTSWNQHFLMDRYTIASSYIGWLIFRYKDPTTRVDRLVLKPQRATTTMWPEVLTLDMSDRITVNVTPRTGTGGVITKQVYIRSVTHEYANRDWTTTYTLDDADWTSAVHHYDDGTRYDTGGAVYSF